MSCVCICTLFVKIHVPGTILTCFIKNPLLAEQDPHSYLCGWQEGGQLSRRTVCEVLNVLNQKCIDLIFLYCQFTELFLSFAITTIV